MPNVKMGADISSFKSGISAAKNEVKTLDQQMKMLDATMKAEGRSEQTLNQQTQTLNSRLAAQKNIAKQAEAALKAMTQAGVDPASDSYQKMAREMLAAQTGMMETQAALNDLGNGAVKAAGGVSQLESGLNGISKKISLEQVRDVVGKISDGLENAAKKAVNLGKAIWENITDVARFSDDTATQAMILNMNVEDYQAYKKVFDTVGEITVQEWQKAKQKVQAAINKPTDEQANILQLLGIQTHDIEYGKTGVVHGAAKDFETVFWEIGETLQKKIASGELTQDLADTYANTLFGKGFAGLNPMFKMGQNAFEEAVKQQMVASEEAINKNAELNDKLVDLKSDFESLKVEVVSGLAPALTKGAEALDSLLTRLMDYMKTPEGQEALKNLETAVTGLFEDLGKIDPEQVVSGFTDVFNTVVGSLQWLVDNKETVGNVLTGIMVTWGAAKVVGGALDILKLIQGIQGLTGSTGAAGAAGTAAGNAWGAGFAAAVAKAAPWLIGIYTLLNPSGTGDKLGNNTLIDKNGNVTAEGQSVGLKKDESGQIIEDRAQIINEAAQKAWDLYRTGQMTQAGMEELRKVVLNDDKFRSLMEEFMSFRNQNGDEWMSIEDIDLSKWMEEHEPPKVIIQPEAPENSAAEIAEQIGTVTVYVEPIIGDPVNNTEKRRRNNRLPGYANGIAYVPDTRLAWLHPGETVTPAREVGSRNFSSNLYVEKMIMGGGTDARGLADEMAAAQRRIMSGYGS